MNFWNALLRGTFFLDKVSFLKGKTLFINDNTQKSNIDNPKRKQNHKVIFFFFMINKTNKGEGRGQFSCFSNDLWKLNFTKNHQNNKLNNFRSNKIRRY